PKGVPLRHCNVFGGVANAAAGGVFREHENYYAYLPAAWVGDFVFSLAAAVLMRFTVNIPERQETVLRDLREVAHTWYLAAPRAPPRSRMARSSCTRSASRYRASKFVSMIMARYTSSRHP